ncbi:uncharacterized protein LOC121749153 [Salvia splendens]|uniref:uncharacterized protein LOC121749153 n=1 Tax=Salvia splendens TaxID=180675 RepID=UPI001C273DF4|nr:uncharacterized protein LOC121749153 [Salvia splendens]
MGFGDKWTNWIMECVRTASMSILVNGSITYFAVQFTERSTKLSTGLVILRGRELGILKGITVGANHVPITHLQFADDTIIFAPANTEIIGNYKKSLQCFGLMSGLKINYGKSTLIPLNCEESWIEEECGVSKLPLIYLGIPLGASPHKAQTWKPIIEKVERRLALWKARTLSKAGRLVLVKAVLSNLPLYYLSLFRMPKKSSSTHHPSTEALFLG